MPGEETDHLLDATRQLLLHARGIQRGHVVHRAEAGQLFRECGLPSLLLSEPRLELARGPRAVEERIEAPLDPLIDRGELALQLRAAGLLRRVIHLQLVEGALDHPSEGSLVERVPDGVEE
jgi:hypothetical protein